MTHMITITGTVGTNGKYLLTGIPVDTTTPAVLKLTFENNTAGTNLTLCAGTIADFNAGNTATLLSSSGGPGFIFLTIIDAQKLAGKAIYVLRAVGTAASQFTLNID
jgi:hypothetical protein